MKFDSFDGGVGGEHNGVSLADISNVFLTLVDFFFGAEPFDKLLMIMIMMDT